jgi:hypothetical protein
MGEERTDGKGATEKGQRRQEHPYESSCIVKPTRYLFTTLTTHPQAPFQGGEGFVVEPDTQCQSNG